MERIISQFQQPNSYIFHTNTFKFLDEENRRIISSWWKKIQRTFPFHDPINLHSMKAWKIAAKANKRRRVTSGWLCNQKLEHPPDPKDQWMIDKERSIFMVIGRGGGQKKVAQPPTSLGYLRVTMMLRTGSWGHCEQSWVCVCMHVGIRVREGEERERKKNAFDLLRTKIVKTRKLDGNYICYSKERFVDYFWWFVYLFFD